MLERRNDMDIEKFRYLANSIEYKKSLYEELIKQIHQLQKIAQDTLREQIKLEEELQLLVK